MPEQHTAFIWREPTDLWHVFSDQDAAMALYGAAAKELRGPGYDTMAEAIDSAIFRGFTHMAGDHGPMPLRRA